jgi:hypothetical protein
MSGEWPDARFMNKNTLTKLDFFHHNDSVIV